MTERTYPYTAWRLMPSFKPVEVTLVDRAYPYSWDDVDKDALGNTYKIGQLYDSKPAAIAAGRAKVVLLQKDIETRQETLFKRIRVLDLAEGKK